MKRSTTKNSLLMSVLSLFLCFAMLTGTTFAWFTDTVESGVNQIVAGNLDIELYHADKGTNGANVEVKNDTVLFDDVDSTKWEPGAMAYEVFTVENKGNLALKYELTLNAINPTVVDGVSFASMLKVAVIEDETFVYSRENIANITTWNSLATFTLPGTLEAKAEGATANPSKTYGIVIWWQPSDLDNKFNMNNGQTVGSVKVDIGVDLVATQLMAESDSFGSDYDKPADYPMLEKSEEGTAAAGKSTVLNVATAPSLTNKLTTVTVPAGAVADGGKVAVAVNPNNTLFNVSATGEEVATIEVKLTVDGAETDGLLTDGSLYTVETYISKGLTNPTIEFTGTAKAEYVAPVVVEYNAETGYLKFTTNHFSEYAVKSVVLAYDKAADVAISEVTKLVEALKNPDSNFVAPSVEVVEKALDNAVENGKIEADAAQGIIDNVQAIVKNYVARVGADYYTDLAEAIAAANNGTLVLLADLTLEESLTIAEGTVLTLDLGGNKISGSITGNPIILNNGSLVIKNGVVENTAENGGATINNKGTLTLNAGANIVGAPIARDSGYPSYCIANSANLTVNEGANVSADRGCLYISGNGETVINGGTFTNNDISVKLGERTFTSHVVVVAYGANNKLTINGGTFKHLHTKTSGGVVINNWSAVTVDVNGGNFSGGNYFGKWDNLSDYGYGSTKTPFAVKGGTFTGMDNKFIVKGYKVENQEDGTYKVVLDLSIMAAKVGNDYYETIAEAFAAAKDGDTITLLSDKTLTETLVFDKEVSVTFDLGGHTISGQIGTLLKLANGTINLKNGALKNEHEAATETKYSVYMTGDAVAKIENVAITTTGVGIYMGENAKITELNATVDSYMNANGYCCYDAISMVGNARIDEISGGKYESHYADSYIAAWDVDHKYSGIASYTVNLNDANVSIGEISGGTFLGVMDKANNGTPIHVNNGTVELISGGYFGFSQTGLTQPDTLLYVNTNNGGAINKITGGTFVKGDWKGFGCDFAAIVEASGCQVTETSETVDVYVHFSARVATYTLTVVEVTTK